MSKTWRSPAVITSLVVGLAVALSLLAGVFLATDQAEAKINIPSGSGTDYYVDAVNGDDDNGGTSWLDAWKTITHAADIVPAGASTSDPNIIHVADGTYDHYAHGETFPITFDEENVTLLAHSTGALIDQEWVGTGTGSVLRIEATGITIYGFTLDNAGYGIVATVGGFAIGNNTFSNDTDHDITCGVFVNIYEDAQTSDLSFDSIIIEDNEFYISEDGVKLCFDIDFSGDDLDIAIGDIDILDNNFYMDTTDGIDIYIGVEDVSGGTVTVGNIDISDSNMFSGGDYGVYFDSYLHNLNNTTVNIGDLMINDNTFTGQNSSAVYIDSYYESDSSDYDDNNWRGATAVTIGDIEVNGNNISSSQPACWGVFIGEYAYWDYLEDDVTVTAGDISIEDNNPIDIDGEYAVYVGYYDLEHFRDNAAVTLDDLSIQGNTITAGNYGVYIEYYECAYYMEGSSSVTFGGINIEGNDIETSNKDGIYLEMDDLGSSLSGNAQVNLGDIDVLNNNAIDAADHGIYLRFGVYYGFGENLYGSTVFTAGDVNIQGNVVTADNWMGIYVYYDDAISELYDNAQASLGNLNIEENDVTTNTHNGIKVKYYECAHWIENIENGAQIGNVTISNNGINAAGTNSYGVLLEYDDVGDDLYNNAEVSVGTVDISGNHAVGDEMAPMTTGNIGIYLFFNDFGASTYNDSSATFGDITMQNNNIDSGHEGIYLWYCYVGYYVYDSSDVTVGAVDISNNNIDSAHWISAVKILYEYVAYEMGNETDPCDATLNLGDISFYDNTIAGDSDGINIEYYDAEVGYYMYDTAQAELPSYSITGNTFNVSGDGIYYYNCDNPYYIYDNTIIDFGGMLIDDNTFNDQDVGMYYGVYIEHYDLGYTNYDGSTTIVGDFTISNNEFYDLASDAVYVYYDDVGYGLYENSILEVGNLEISDNTISGANYGINIEYNPVSSDDSSTLTMGNVDITGNTISGIVNDGIAISYNLDANSSSTLTVGRALIQDNFLDQIMAGSGIYIYTYPDPEPGATITLGEPVIDRNIIEDWSNGIYLQNVDGATISNNFIKDNLCGIYLSASDNIDITNNDILTNPGSASGVHVETDCGTNINVNYNNIVANSSGDWGIYNASTNLINAEHNWWGDPSGPEDEAGDINGSGDKISHYVDANPWLTGKSHVTIYEQTATATGSGTASIQTEGGAITELESVAEGTLPAAGKPDITFPNGFFSFKIIGLTPGQEVNVTLTLPDNVPVGTAYWKYGPTLANPTPHWYSIPIGDDDGDNVITITLVDGGLGDHDLAEDGEILEPGAPGYVPVATIVLAPPERPEPEPEPEASEPPGVARFNVTNLYVAPNEVPPNQPVNVWADIANVGSEYGLYDVVLFINGEKEGGQRIYLYPGGNKRVLFQVSRPTPGTYTVSVSNQSGWFTVKNTDWTVEVAPPAPSGGLGTPALIAIILSAVGVGIAVFFSRRRTA
jgi:parallel beta-helix repeat protein